jgi:hypothetical protein
MNKAELTYNKLCRNCKFYSNTTLGTLPTECNHNIAKGPSGEQETFAIKARFISGFCGPEGKYFERKKFLGLF